MLLLFAVFFTNLLSLSCQILWIRKIGFLFGTTHGTMSTILSIFLLGLALGALIGGKIIDRAANRMKIVALIEILLGVYCMVSMPLLEGGQGVFLALLGGVGALWARVVLRLLLVFLCLILPTLCIGAVFPVVTRMIADGKTALGRSVSLVYGLDTLGAGVGALLSGFILVPYLGLQASSLLLGAVCALLGVLFLMAGKEQAGPSELEAPVVSEAPAPPLRRIYPAFFLSGAAALLLETGWNRYFCIVNGSSVFSLSVVVSAFLMGMGAGSFWIQRRIDSIKRPFRMLMVLDLLIPIGGMLVFQFGRFFGRMYYALFQAISNYEFFQFLIFLVIFVNVFLATLAMGANFPLVVKVCGRGPDQTGEGTGKAFFINTLGAAAGALAGEFLVLPLWGFSGLTLLVILLYGVAAFLFLGLAEDRSRRTVVLWAVLLLGAVVLSPPATNWDLPRDAVYYHAVRYPSWEAYRRAREGSRLLFQKDGFYGRVSVEEIGGRLILKNNGKTDASNLGGNIVTQMLVSHLPLCLHPDPREVAVIGVGGGFTLAAAAHHADVEALVQVELDPLVVHAARAYFAGLTDRVLDDPRVEIVIDDGRNFVMRTPRRFDVIVSEPPNIWVSGVSGLFTREFYLSIRPRLKPGGILCQWLPMREMEATDVDIALATMRSVFPHVAMWSDGTDAIVIVSDTLPQVDPLRLERLAGWPGIGKDLRSIGKDPAWLASFMASPRISEADLDARVKGVRPLNRDDRPVLEFRTARNLFRMAKGRR
jgi:spermidine synthase/MFS family permease